MTRTMLTATCLLASLAHAAPPIKALIVTGANNHNWRLTSRMFADTLESTGRFSVTITDNPQSDLAKPETLAGVQVIVLDYNNSPDTARWGEAADKSFLAAVNAGAGVVAVHAADNAFKGWTEYEKMLGLMWRDGSAHGKFHPFDVEFTDTEHPIIKGLAPFKAHPDELYHKLVNTQKADVHLLARAMSDKESGGTGEYEPMAFTLTYGKGRVFATPLGHVWVGSDESKVSIADPQFKVLLARGAEWAATGQVTLPATWTDATKPNTLSAAEAAQGWTLLFDGSSTKGWHAWKKTEAPAEGWSVVDGALTYTPGKKGGDIATDADYADFELALDWRVAPGGNSGIMYRCTEDHGYPWETGRECQILDDARHADGKKAKTRAGTMYDMFPCAVDVARPAGEWNHVRIVCHGTRIEHWLNGFKVVETDTATDAYAAAYKASKFVSMADYGQRASGRIALQDHGDAVAFRNIKVRVIKP